MARELLLIRHGIAVERGSTATDEERALTAEGRARTRKVLQRLEKLDLSCGPLVSSPLVRARQTAELALQLELGDTLSFSDALSPGHDPMPLLLELLEEPWWHREPGHEQDRANWPATMGCSTNSTSSRRPAPCSWNWNYPSLSL